MSVAEPLEPQRIKSLDVLRGFALLGILAVNAAFFAGPWQTGVNPTLAPLAVTDDTLWSWSVVHVVFEYKCITLFSMLFGVSIYLVGGEREDKERGAVLTRRLAWLLVFGLMHALLLWYGDILTVYALTGLLVMLVRSWKPTALVATGVALFLTSIAINFVAALAFGLLPPEQLTPIVEQAWAPSDAEIARQIAAFSGGYLSGFSDNVNVWTTFLAGLPFTIARTGGMMMVGLALFKLGFLSGRAPVWVYLLVALTGAGALALIAWQASINAALGFPFLHMQQAGALANSLLSPLVTLLYASILILLVRFGALRFVTDALSAVGRMAFTNYIAQSLIMTVIFRGFGLFGDVARPELLGVVAAIWIAQLIWSPLWLAHCTMGPLEWVWRRLTYNRPVPFLKAPVHNSGASA